MRFNNFNEIFVIGRVGVGNCAHRNRWRSTRREACLRAPRIAALSQARDADRRNGDEHWSSCCAQSE